MICKYHNTFGLDPGDIIVRQGEVGREMYFVGEGKVEVRVYSQDLERGGGRPARTSPPPPAGENGKDAGADGGIPLRDPPRSSSGGAPPPPKGKAGRRGGRKASQQVYLQHDDLSHLPFL